ncbi:MAG: HAD-IA family hydrolase [Pseudomonadota bacterium]
MELQNGGSAKVRKHEKCLVLDAMGVIYHSADDVGELLIPFIQENGGTSNEARIKGYYHQASLGQLSVDKFWQKCGLTPELEDEYLQRHMLTPGLRSALEYARSQEWLIWCLSNDIGRWSKKLRENFKIEGYFDGFIISGDVKCRKPSADIYRKLVKASKIKPEKMRFVDDRPANLVAALELGMNPILFERGNPVGSLNCPVIKGFDELGRILN